MSNHYHLVLKIDPAETRSWPDSEVLKRWTCMFRGTVLVQRFIGGDALTEAEQQTLRETTAVYRDRLGNLSWFMRCLNEPIARQANVEDDCTGHFWEARFHSQALLTEKALFSAMAYVDLNPVRARTAATPEASDCTSIRARTDSHYEDELLEAARRTQFRFSRSQEIDLEIRQLMPFATCENDASGTSLPMLKRQYLILVDETARAVVDGKRGYLTRDVVPVLERLGLTQSEWLDASCAFRRHFYRGDIRVANAA